MKKILIAGAVGGLLGALTGVLVEKVISAYKSIQDAENELQSFTDADYGEPVAYIQPGTGKVTHYEEDLKKIESINNKIYNYEECELEYEESEDLTFDEQLMKEASEKYITTINFTSIEEKQHWWDWYDMYNRHSKEELKDLNYDKNEQKAWDQYVAMRLADIQPSPWRDVIFRLFGIAFNPTSEHDETLVLHAEQDREEFFGTDSIYSKGATMGEIFMHFAELLEYDLGESVDLFAEELVNNCNFTPDMPLNELENNCHLIENHDYYTKNGFGIFALKPAQQLLVSDFIFSEYNNSSYLE